MYWGHIGNHVWQSLTHHRIWHWPQGSRSFEKWSVSHLLLHPELRNVFSTHRKSGMAIAYAASDMAMTIGVKVIEQKQTVSCLLWFWDLRNVFGTHRKPCMAITYASSNLTLIPAVKVIWQKWTVSCLLLLLELRNVLRTHITCGDACFVLYLWSIDCRSISRNLSKYLGNGEYIRGHTVVSVHI